MRFVLDTNEFITALEIAKNPASAAFLNILIRTFPKHTIHIPRTIFNEAKRNLPPIISTYFVKIVQSITTIDEDDLVLFEKGAKYESPALKAADAFMAAATEWIGADVLVIENRHFLPRHGSPPSKVLKAEQCMKILSK